VPTDCLLLLALITPASDSVNRALRYRIDIPASIEVVWAAWTDTSRIREWFAPASRIDLRPLGTFEILFAPHAPPGKRGAENNLILAVQPPEMLAFTWDAPPNLGEARKQRTSVVVRFRRLSASQTRVWFEQTGWGRGGDWDKAHAYFTSAWKVVLSLLHYRHTVGPVDWTKGLPQDAMAEHGKTIVGW